MDKWQLEERVIDVVATEIGISNGELSLDALLREDLHADPLTIVEIVLSLEESFGIEIEDADFGTMNRPRLRTVGDVTNCLACKVLGAHEMIGTDQALALLRGACPTAPTLESEREGSEDAVGFDDMSNFARHVVNSDAEGDPVGEVPGFFRLLESLIVQGYFQVRLLAIFGLIEDIQTIASHTPKGYQVFERWLGTASMEAWRDVEAIWAGRGSLADIVRAERRGQATAPRRLLQTRSHRGALQPR